MTAPAIPTKNFASVNSRYALVAIVLVAIVLRFRQIDRYSFWIDEIASLQMSDGYDAGEFAGAKDVVQSGAIDTTAVDEAQPLAAIRSSLSHDTHPPLYFFLLRFWRELFGSSDTAARSLSAVASVGCVLVVYDAAQTLHGRATALWATAITAVASPQIEFAQQTRGYSLLVLLILCAVAALARIQKLGPSPPRLVALSAAMLGALLTHYLAVPALLAITLCAILQLKSRSRLLTIYALSAAAVIAIAVWGPTLWAQRFNFAANFGWLGDNRPGLFSRTLDRLGSLPVQFFISPVYLHTWTVRIGAILYLSPLLLFWRRDLLIWILLAAAMIAATTLSDLLNHRRQLEEMRFLIGAAPAAYVLVAAVAANLRDKRIGNVFAAAVVLWCIAWLPQQYDQFWRSDYRSFTQKFDFDAGANDLIIAGFVSHEDWDTATLFAAITHYSKFPHRPLLVLSRAESDQLRSQASGFPAAWWLGTRVDIGDFLPGVRIDSIQSIFGLGMWAGLDLSAPPATSPATQGS